MEISKIRDRRDQLERDISQLIVNFIGETQVDISEIEFSQSEKLQAFNAEGRRITAGDIMARIDVKLEI